MLVIKNPTQKINIDQKSKVLKLFVIIDISYINDIHDKIFLCTEKQKHDIVNISDISITNDFIVFSLNSKFEIIFFTELYLEAHIPIINMNITTEYDTARNFPNN